MSEGPFDIGLDWKAEVAAARRLQGRHRGLSRQPDQLAQFRRDARRELGAAGAPALRLEDRAAPHALGEGSARRGRPRAGGSVGWPDAYAFTKALGEQALTESKGDVPVSIVRPSIIESALGRAAARMDPRVPHGRAGDHLLRPWAAEGVPRHAGGHGRRDPRRHGRRRDHRRRRGRARAGAGDHPGRVRWHQPAQVPHARRQRQRLVHRASAVRQRGPADRGSRVELPRSRSRAGAADAGQVGDHARREGDAVAAAAGQAGRVLGHARAEAAARSNGPSSTSSCTASTPSARRSTRSTTCSRCGSRSTPSTSSSSCSTRAPSTGRLHPRDPPAVDRRARPGQATPGKSRSTDRMVRLRKQVLDPKRHVAAFDLENTLIASNVVESYSLLATRRLNTPERIRYVAAHARPGAGTAEARPARPHRLPPPLLPTLRGRAGRPDRGGRPRAADPAHHHQELPRRHPPCARAPRRWVIARS